MDLRIAVIIPVYKAEAFVERAVASALAQPEVVEVMLVEDGSPDGSLAACERAAQSDPRVHLLRHVGGANKGAGASRNLGIRSSTAPFIAFLDADDVYLPDRFKAEQSVFAAHADAEGVYNALGVQYASPEARDRFLQQFPQDELTTVTQRVAPERLFSGLVGSVKGFGYFSIDALTVARKAVERLGAQPFPEELRLHQDSEFLLKIAHGSRLYPGELNRPVALRGVHDANRITTNKDRAGNAFKLYRRLERWSRTVAMDRTDRRELTAKRVYWGLFLCTSKGQVLLYARHFLRHPWLLHRVVVREAWIDALCGEGSRTAKALRSFSWRLFRNDPRPV